MPVYLDDHIDEHPKILAAGDAGAWLWTACIAYSKRHRTGGRIPKNWPGFAGRARRQALAKALTAGILERDGDDIVVHDYSDANWSEEKRSAAGAKAAAARWSKGSNGDANRNAIAHPDAMPPRCTSPPTPDSDSSPQQTPEVAREPTEDDEIFDQACQLLAHRRLQQRQGPPVTSRRAYLATVAADVRLAYAGRWHTELEGQRADWTPPELADALEPVDDVVDDAAERAKRDIERTRSRREDDAQRDTEQRAEVARLDALIEDLDEHERSALRARAEAELPSLNGRRAEPAVRSMMRQLVATGSS